jgi:hypothetical protein
MRTRGVMRTMNRARAALVASALAAWPTTGWAQSVVGPQVPGGAPSAATQSGAVTTVVVIVTLLGVLVVLGALIKFIDLKRKREGEAVVVQARISDAILHDSRLFSLAITPTARIPRWKGTPVTIEVAGQVPSDDLRQVVIRLVEREASQLAADVRIESRIGVMPHMVRRSA